MAEYKADLRDVMFVLFEQLHLEECLGRAPYADYDRETIEMMIAEAYKFARDILSPINEVSDRVGARFKDGQVTTPPGTPEAYARFVENGWMGLNANPEYGGQGAPAAIGAAVGELMEGACLAFNLTRLLTTGCSHLIETFGDEALKSTYCEKLYSGEWTGTMCLTEAGAGTDVGASRTTAKPAGDGHPAGAYLIEGEKVFITSGEHDLARNIIHAVLARTPGSPEGTRGLSLFVVPKRLVDAKGKPGALNNVECIRIEEKLGIHGSPTCVLGFGGRGDCYGWLLGEEHAGMREMFQMMNEARLAVGIEGAALGNAAYQQALIYCRERVQGGDITRRKKGRVEIIEHPDVRMMLMWQKAHAEGIRVLGYFTAACIDREAVAEAAGDTEAALRHHGMLEVLTPVIKAWGSDTGFRVADRAMQCYGGYGYTREFPAEQYLRDVRISGIYEGANGIQALDLVGRKLGQRGGEDTRALHDELQRIARTISGPGLSGVALRVHDAITALKKVVAEYWARAKSDPLGPVLNASGFLELAGQVVVGTLLGEQASIATAALGARLAEKGVAVSDVAAIRTLADADDEVRFLWGKITSARFFAERVLATAPSVASVLLCPDRSAMEIVF